ncbi:MAG: tetratricopeptide repeat protein [Bacteroidia bacterium]|nr:tetratricopeptide repeat protein [Bacteroidia bacterium]
MTVVRFIIILLLINAVNETVMSQQSKADSLLLILKTAKHDTVKLKVLIDISRLYGRMSEYKLAMEYAQKVIQLSEKIISSGDEKLVTSAKESLANSYNYIGIIYRNQSDFKQAKSFYLKAMKLYEEVADKEGLATEWNNLGNISGDEGNYKNSLEFHNKALVLRNQLLEELKKKSEISEVKLNESKKMVAASNNNIGTVYYMWGDYNKANASFFEALKISEEINDKITIAGTCNNIGEIQRLKGDYNKALEFYKKAHTIYKEMNDIKDLSTTLTNIGVVYFLKHDYQNAMDYFISDLNICEKEGNKQGVAHSNNNLGGLFYDMADEYFKNGNAIKAQAYYDKSIECYLKSLKIREEIGDKQGVGNSFFSIGELYRKQGKIVQAKEYLLRSLGIATEINSKPDLKNIYENLSEIDSANGHFKGAYEYYKLFSHFKDSLFNEEIKNKSSFMQFSAV